MLRWLLLVVVLVLGAAVASAQTCTLGPYTSATSLSTIATAINGGTCGSSVACLQRGESWSGTLSLNKACSDGSRITICSSTDNACSGSGAANANINVSGNSACVSMNSSTAGLTFKNLDCTHTSPSSNDSFAWTFGHNQSYITIEGGKTSGFRTWGICGSATYCSNMVWGKCGNPVEVTGGPDGDYDRYVFYSGLRNSSLSFYVHDYKTSQRNTSHWIDYAENGTLNWDAGSHDVVMECSTFRPASGDLAFSMFKTNRGYNLTFRDNVFDFSAGGGVALAFSSHFAGGTEGISGGGVPGAGASIYRNTFIGGSALWLGIARDIDVYNNLLDMTTSSSGSYGLVRFPYDEGQAEDIVEGNVRIFNNTIYKGSSGTPSFPFISTENSGSGDGGNQIFNNIFVDLLSDARIWSGTVGGCGYYGTNGVNIHHNFVYTPNDATPDIWSGCSARHDNSGQSGDLPSNYSTSPGFISAGTNFDITTGSAVYGKALGGGAPADDFDLETRPNPASVGAFDVGVSQNPPSSSITIRGAGCSGCSIVP